LSTSQNSLDPALLQSTVLSAAETQWYAVHTRPRFEKKIASQLQEKGIEVFLPLISAKHQWSDRKQLVHTPLFPSYVFVRMDAVLDTKVCVLRTSGVHGFVGVRGAGTPIPDDEISAVQMLIEQRVPFAPHPFVKLGQRVRVRGGSLDGIEGILTAVNGDESLVLSVDLIQKSVAMRIVGFEVEPV
jgi:transcription elongation factor/antiterminator RfaH